MARTNKLIEGDPLEPTSTDVIFQEVSLSANEVPGGIGWRIMTGNNSFNLWMRVAYRYEITDKIGS